MHPELSLEKKKQKLGVTLTTPSLSPLLNFSVVPRKYHMFAEVSTSRRMPPSVCQQVQQESASLSRGVHGSMCALCTRLPTKKSATTRLLSCACVTQLLHLHPSRLSCLLPLTIQGAANAAWARRTSGRRRRRRRESLEVGEERAEMEG